jgi:hypothetical protein
LGAHQKRDFLFIGVRKYLAVVKAALNVVGLRFFGEYHGYAEFERAYRTKRDARCFYGEYGSEAFEWEKPLELVCELIHECHVDAVVQKTVYLDDVAGQYPRLAADAFFEKLHIQPSFSIQNFFKKERNAPVFPGIHSR